MVAKFTSSRFLFYLHLHHIKFKNGNSDAVTALYTRNPFVQQNLISILGNELNDDGYNKVDPTQNKSVPGLFACGNNTTRMRTVDTSVAMGTTAGMMANKGLIKENF